MRISVLFVLLSVAVMWLLVPVRARTPIFSVIHAERSAGQQLFIDHCAACHGRAGVAAGYAPSLVGVVGRRAGSVPAFPYSSALRNSEFYWTGDNLVRWITNPPAMVPGTLMPHVSISDPAERLYLREYLKTLSVH